MEKNIGVKVSLNVEGADSAAKTIDKLGDSIKNVEDSSKSTDGTLRKLGDRFEIFGVSIGDVRNKIDDLRDALSEGSSALVSYAKNFSLGAAGAKVYNDVIGKTITNVLNITSRFLKAKAALVSYNIGVKATTAATVVLSGVQIVATGITIALTVAVRALAVALAATGIPILIAGFTLLVDAIRRNTKLMHKFRRVVRQLGASFRVLGDAILSLNFRNLWSNMKEASKASGELSDAQENAANAAARNASEIKKLEEELAKYKKTAEDASKPAETRLNAIKESFRVIKEINDKEKESLETQIKAAEAAKEVQIGVSRLMDKRSQEDAENDFNRSDAGKQLSDLKSALAESNKRRIENETQIQNLKNSIEASVQASRKSARDKRNKAIIAAEKEIADLKQSNLEKNLENELANIKRVAEEDKKSYKQRLIDAGVSSKERIRLIKEYDTVRQEVADKDARAAIQNNNQKKLENEARISELLHIIDMSKMDDRIQSASLKQQKDELENIKSLKEAIRDAEDRQLDLSDQFSSIEDPSKDVSDRFKSEMESIKSETEQLKGVLADAERDVLRESQAQIISAANVELIKLDAKFKRDFDKLDKDDKAAQLALEIKHINNRDKIASKSFKDRFDDEREYHEQTIINLEDDNDAIEEEQKRHQNAMIKIRKDANEHEKESDAKHLKKVNEARANAQKKAQDEEIKAIQDKIDRVNLLGNAAINTSNSIGEAINQNLQDALNYADNMLDAQQRNIERARRNADKGGVEALQLEEDRLDELQLKREEIQDKQTKANKAFRLAEIAGNTALQIANIKLGASLIFRQTGVAAPIAIPIALAAFAGLMASIPSFYEGTDNFNPTNQKVNDGLGGSLAILHPNERVVPASVNKHLNGIKNADLPSLISNNSGLIAAVNETNKRLDNLEIYFNVDQRGFSAGMSQFTKRQVRRNKLIR
jgi:hypothetical protein